MTNRELIALNKGLHSVANLKGVRFIYAVSKNKKALQSEIEIIKEAGNLPEGYAKYEAERIKLCEFCAEEDDRGNPIVDPETSSYLIKDKEAFNDTLAVLRKEFKAEIEEHEKAKKEFEAFLDEENTIVIHTIPMDQISQEITSLQFEAISPMIEDY